MKIVYCTNSVSTRGGIERVTIVKANALAEIPGNEVYIVFTDACSFPETIHPLSPKIKVVDLKVGHWDDQYKTRWERFYQPKRKLFLHYMRMQNFVSKIRPDIIVSVGQCEKPILPFLRHKRFIIREVHFNSTYRSYTWGKKNWKVKIADFIDYRLLCRLYDRTFLLTKEDKESNFANDDYISYMHNPSTFEVDLEKNEQSLREKIVLAVGRLNTQKNFLSLIRAWSIIANRHPDWKLRIIGEGPQQSEIERLIRDLQLEQSVQLPGFSSRVDDEMRRASLFVLSSEFEGFALVLIEAMACRLPVVSYATPYGPRDILSDGESGFLVPLKDEKVLASRIEELILNDSLRKEMGRAAEERAALFSVNSIVKKWMNIFNELANTSH